jgi:hypothetical protein
MRNSAASSHRPAYRPTPGVKGSLRRASPALDPRPRATVVMHRYPLEIQERQNIRLIEGDHDIDCKIDGIGAMQLKSEFVKKA